MDSSHLNRPLRVGRLIATKAAALEPGPMVVLNPSDAADRLLNEGELAWIYGPRRHELAEVRFDESLPRGDVVLRDVVGSSPSESIRVIKPDMDRRGRSV